MNKSHLDRSVSFNLSSMDHIEAQTTNWLLSIEPLCPRAFDLDMNLMQAGSFWLGSTTTASGFKGKPRGGSDGWALHVPRNGCYHWYTRTAEYQIGPGMAGLLPVAQMDHMSVSPGFDNLGCSFDVNMVSECMLALEDSRDPMKLCFEPVISLQPDVMRPLALAIKLLSSRLRSGVKPHDLALPLLKEFVICHILAVWPQLSMQPVTSSGKVQSAGLRRAVEYIENNIAMPLTVAEVAVASGTSVRILQAEFRREYGLAPIGFILGRRLEYVHEELQAAPPGSMISQIAYRWGFLHLSDFARRYRQRFGCLPSETYNRDKQSR